VLPWQADGLHANVVTYNTLIDIYGKLGRWQEAIKVLDMITEKVGFLVL
jgi:pentatricopeptide repeat domain-containing protein 1